jgi:hypothetical protein
MQVVKVGCSPHFRQGGDIGFGDLVFPWGHTKHLDSLKQVKGLKWQYGGRNVSTRAGFESPNADAAAASWRMGRAGIGTPRPRAPMNWPKIARCTAVAIGATFVLVAAVFLAVRVFGLVF